jgi:cysteine desulfurase
MAQALRPGRASTLYAASEHPSVRENCLLLQRLGRPVRALPVSPEGMLDRERLEDALTKKDDGHAAPRFLAVMAVNNETGVINEIPAIARLVRERASAPVHIHCDIVQAAGKVPITLSEWDVDSAALSAHKLGGPRGIGLLYLRKPLEPLYRGGGQEKGLRPGTENTAGALALAAVLEARVKNLRDADARARERFRHLISELKKMPRCALIPSCRAADDARFSPWILQAAFSGAPGEVLTRSLDEAGFAVSTGSACSSRSPERPVLEAMGVSEARRLEGIRISQGWTTTREDIDALLEALREALAFL